MLDPVYVERHGKKVWEVAALEPLRKEACLCMRCTALKPGQPDNCPIAQSFVEICKAHGCAFILTRCDSWHDPDDWCTCKGDHECEGHRA